MYLTSFFCVVLLFGTTLSFYKPSEEKLRSEHLLNLNHNRYDPQYNLLSSLLRKSLLQNRLQKTPPSAWSHDQALIRLRKKDPKRSLHFQFQPDITTSLKAPLHQNSNEIKVHKKSYTPQDYHYRFHYPKERVSSSSGQQNIGKTLEQDGSGGMSHHSRGNFDPDNGPSVSHYQHKPLQALAEEPRVIDMTRNPDEYEKMISNYIYGSQPIGLDFSSSRNLISLGVGIVIIVIIASMVLAMRLHYRNQERDGSRWVNHPSVRPSTANPGAIQPGFPSYLGQSEPIRIKAKGLLERRGSNTSLTIDLGGSTGDCGDSVFSPSRECTPEDFLMTAGSRMSRLQLRQSLRNSKLLHAEFWQIPSNHPERCTVPGAASKNRYRTVLPNEGTRVVLHKAFDDSPEIPSSQYINANYIRGYDGEEKAYIATQGPLAHTIEDLWILVLQMKSPAVVMITRLKEKGRVKCEAYIPTYAASYGSVHVTVKQVIQKNGYTIRQILVKRGEDVHTTLHFWFTSWPDHKTPASARHILAMAAEVETARKQDPRKGPIIVHCSAGIGRTGCFIAISIGMIQMLEENCVDILSSVCQMRLDRGGMVQTAEQYEFIYRALSLYEASLPLSAAIE